VIPGRSHFLVLKFDKGGTARRGKEKKGVVMMRKEANGNGV